MEVWKAKAWKDAGLEKRKRKKHKSEKVQT